MKRRARRVSREKEGDRGGGCRREGRSEKGERWEGLKGVWEAKGDGGGACGITGVRQVSST